MKGAAFAIFEHWDQSYAGKGVAIVQKHKAMLEEVAVYLNQENVVSELQIGHCVLWNKQSSTRFVT